MWGKCGVFLGVCFSLMAELTTQDIDSYYRQLVSDGIAEKDARGHALYLAMREQNQERITSLLALAERSRALINLDVQNQETGKTPICMAAEKSRFDVVEHLRRLGANLTLVTNSGQTVGDLVSLLERQMRPAMVPRLGTPPPEDAVPLRQVVAALRARHVRPVASRFLPCFSPMDPLVRYVVFPLTVAPER